MLISSLMALVAAVGPGFDNKANLMLDGRVRLLFSIDQGFGNGLVVNGDKAALQRIFQALRTLRPRYDVYAIINPQIANRANVMTAMDLCMGSGVPFFLTIQSSDGMTLGSFTPPNEPVDPTHGVTISPQQLLQYKFRYGKHLAGIQFFEVFSQDFTLRAGRTKEPTWINPKWKLPAKEDSFFSIDLMRDYFRIAWDRRMQVQWSDWHWTHFADWDKEQFPQEEAFKKLLAEFPGLVTVTYANNEPNEDSAKRLANWPEAMLPFVKAGARDFGLSCQSWLRKDEQKTPVSDMIEWTKNALDSGAAMIQYEPVWYFFKAQRGVFENGWTPAADYGTPTENFVKLAAFLNSYTPAKASAPAGERAGTATTSAPGR